MPCGTWPVALAPWFNHNCTHSVRLIMLHSITWSYINWYLLVDSEIQSVFNLAMWCNMSLFLDIFSVNTQHMASCLPLLYIHCYCFVRTRTCLFCSGSSLLSLLFHQNGLWVSFVDHPATHTHINVSWGFERKRKPSSGSLTEGSMPTWLLYQWRVATFWPPQCYT